VRTSRERDVFYFLRDCGLLRVTEHTNGKLRVAVNPDADGIVVTILDEDEEAPR
jgi:hypothetical protein